MTEIGAHLSLLVTAFLAATILPGSSEALLAGLIALYPASMATLFVFALAGNTAGAVVNWYLGRSLLRLVGSRWFPATAKHIDQGAAFFNRYGSWPLLFSWLPIIGDPLTVAAGVLRIRFSLFLTFVAIGKAARYGVVIAGVELVRASV